MSESQRLGKKDPCICRSGKPFGECCFREGQGTNVDEVPVVRLSRLPTEHLMFLKHELERQSHFGDVRPLIHLDHKGEKVIAVGNEILHSNNWNTPADFLTSYLQHVLTPEWGNAELARPLKDRHPVLQWFDGMSRFKSQQPAGPDGITAVVPNGAMRAWLLLALDLFTVRNHVSLQKGLVGRLKQPAEFQSARHELFAAATCIRAGFDIAYEADKSKPQGEFIATHRLNQQRITVEAKCCYRDGVLGRAGIRVPDEEVRIRPLRRISKALKKPTLGNPLVIFFDLNLPANSPSPLTPTWFEKIADPILVDRDAKSASDPWNLLIFSNYPDHYAMEESPAPDGYAVGMFGKNPSVVAQYPEEINAVFGAALKFGNLPNRFEEME